MSCFPFLFSKVSSSSARPNPDTYEDISGIENGRIYTYKELRNATENFSQANKIGEGNFGSVYKGRLKDGKIAAIKVLSAESRVSLQEMEFLTEINVISEIEHENLVRLCGCCVERNNRILVYNYLESNSLAQILLGGSHSIYLDWQTRSRICIGVARGLAFLHEEVRPLIVHGGIKASNILLDKDLTPKISDFGLVAKLSPTNLIRLCVGSIGTMGYFPPEYLWFRELTRKIDIYSFGVLLLEIVSGRCITNTRLPIEKNFLLRQASSLYERKELVRLVDISLNREFDEQACKYLKIGLLCTQGSAKDRPSMSSVVKMLTGEMDVDDSMMRKQTELNSKFMEELKFLKEQASTIDMSTSSTYNTSSASDNQDTNHDSICNDNLHCTI